MAKHLNLDLTVRADTGQAKAQIQELQTILNKIMHTSSTTSLKGIDATKIQQAASAAKELQMHLNNAFNANTGKFDLSQLDKSLKASGSNITDLSTKLLGAGQSGQQAFMKLAQSISLADQPMLRINNKLNEFATTLKNTARWQLSSSMLHGFMGAVQSAYGYAQDLNKSLTDIRIVTGQNTEQMAKFAEEANKAAKNLSTTTTDYTNASLIYYQQGLDNDEVIERTNVTIKMANAAGESAQTVSDQMTAVWNNFAKGGENLEYYADVMTALGAATASSTSEISEGLNKFAAVAETVGLSYEYATAALATVTATTRQSADIVGTAFKTLFARIQDLKLGETLEDGTTLGKYSAALAAVGVDIKDTNDEIKEMDTILEEMAAKWDTLAKDRQVALAQSVAGVRQYTQLIALMDNWDFMQENLETARNAEGTLTEQAEIYAESWEAASKRVKASAQGLYQSLLDDDFFIDVNNGFATMLTGLDAFIDGAGGLKTVLLGISSIIVSNFANKIPEAISTVGYNLKVLTQGSEKAYLSIQKQMQDAARVAFEKQGIEKDSSMGFMIESSNELASARTKLSAISDKMSNAERQMAETELKLMESQQQEIFVLKQKNEELEESIKLQKAQMENATGLADSAKSKSNVNENRIAKKFDSIRGNDDEAGQWEALIAFNQKHSAIIDNLEQSYSALGKKILNSLDEAGNATENIVIDLKDVDDAVKTIDSHLENLDMSEARAEFQTLSDTIPQAIQSATGLDRIFSKIITSVNKGEMQEHIKKLQEKLKDCQIPADKVHEALSGIYGKSKADKLINDMKLLANQTKKADAQSSALSKTFKEFQPTHIVRTSEALGSLAGMMGNVVTIGNSVKSIFTSWTNPDLSGWEKFSATLSGVSMIIPGVISSLKGYGTVISFINSKIKEQTMVQYENLISTNLTVNTRKNMSKALTEEQIQRVINIAAIEKENGADQKAIATSITDYLLTNKICDAKTAEAIARGVSKKAIDLENLSRKESIILQLKSLGLWNAWAAVAAVALVAAVGAVIYFATEQKRANKAISESLEKYKEAASGLEELENELKTVQDRIKELESMDSLTIVEQEELNKLRAEEASLERQVELKEALAKAAKDQAAQEFVSNAEKASQWSDTAPDAENKRVFNETIDKDGITQIEEAEFDENSPIGQKLKEEAITAEEYKEKYIDTLDTTNSEYAKLYEERLQIYEDWIAKNDEARSKWALDNEEDFNNYQEGFLNWLNSDQFDESKIEEYSAPIKDYYKNAFGENYQDVLYGSDSLNTARTEEEERSNSNYDKIIQDTLKDNNYASYGDAAKKLAETFSDEFKAELYARGLVPEDYANYLVKESQAATVNAAKHLFQATKGSVQLGQLMEHKRWSEEDLEIIAEIEVNGEDNLDSIFDKIENYKENKIVTSFDVAEWKTGYNEKKTIASDLNTGDTISADDFKKLGEAYSHFFELQSDGTYKLIADAKDLKATIEAIETSELREMMNIAGSKVKEAENITLSDGSTQRVGISQASELAEKDTNGMLTQQEIEIVNAYKQSVEEAFGRTVSSMQEAVDLVQQYNDKISQSQEAIFNSATSLQELQSQRKQLLEETGQVDYSQYSEALTSLASQYANTTQEIERYQLALQNGNQTQIEAAEDALNAATLIGEAAEKYDFDSEVLEVQAEQIQKLNPEMELNAEQAAQMAVNNQRMNKGIKTLNDNFKDWKKTFKNADKDSMDYADAIVDCTDAIADLVGASEDLELPSEFFENTENMKLIEKAMKGDVEAINKLGGAVAQCTVEALEFNGQMARLATETWVENGLNVDVGLNIGQFEEDKNTVLSAIQGIRDGTLQAGSEMDAGWVAALNRMALATGMSVEEMNGLLGSMGVQAKVETKYVKQKTQVPTYTEVKEPVPVTVRESTSDGRIESRTKYGWKSYTIPGAPVEVEGYVPVAQISTTDNPMTAKVVETSASTSAPAATYSGSSGRGSVSPSSKKSKGSGGGGGNDKKTSDERKNKSDVVERYKEINDQLDITAKKMDDASEIADTLYGSDRIKKMREVSKTLQQEINLLEQKNAEAKKYLSQDKTDLNSAASTLGVGLSYGANGEITNIEDAQTKLFNQREALLDSFGDTINDSEQKLLEALDKKIETFEKALEQYEDTRELRDELDSEILNKKIEWQENNFDIWEESLELNLEVNDNSLSELERKLEDLEDDFYSMAEAAALMIGEVVDGFLDITGTQLENYTEMTTDLAEKKTELDQKYINGSITQADYIEGLKTLKSEVESNSDNIKNLDDAMIHYYGDTLQAAQEELSQYTDLMSQHTEILEHYVNIMDIIGESTDYKKMGVILEGQAKVAENTMKVSKANYEMLNKQREARKAEYEAAMNSATDEELEVLKQKWLDAEAAANDAQDQMMADTETWAESLKAVLENKLAGFAQELENTLTGEWGSFDQMTAAMDRASSLQEEYLTNTNKIYETNKLMNKAQQDLDKTTNSVAKKRLQAYIDETQQLQDQAELSNYELEIQQAKYDLLLAEIALEEAQAAKSTVRLQRDSEGNFGYVYTADSSALAQAEQELEDAQNSLYNIGLKGANDYSQKYQQTLSEMYDSLKELQEQYLSGSFESEQEYNDAVVAAKEYYYEKLKQYSNLYQVALTTDSNVIADAWSSDFNDMIYSTENWQTAVDDYLTQVEGAFTQWEVQIQQIKDETVGPNLEALAEKVEDITTENKELTEQITGEDGLIDALKDEIEQVNNITNAYANQRAEVLALRDANNALITSINSVIAAQTNIDNNENSDNENISENNNNNNNQNSNNNNNQNNDTGDNIDFNKIKIGSEIEVESGSRWYNDSYGAGPTGSARSGTIKSINIKGSHPYNIEGLGWISKSDIKKINRYNTGGYTGDWGPEGKLGILDEKELVLNKNDTANFLASMEILDKILQAIDLQTLNSQIGGILSSPSFGNLETKTLEQQVTIEANFPGVSVASEIEEAFGNLVNLASQYANRK